MGSRNSGNNKINRNNLNCLPREIIYEILTRVPAESLVRFKLVCKLWKTIISDPNFISSHLHIWKSKPSFMFTADFSSNHLLLSDFQDEDSTDFPIQIPKGYRRIVSSTDGLLLLQGYEQKDGHSLTKLCVHNPVTGGQKLLPPTLNHRVTRQDKFSIVCDASIQKYKVVLFIDDGGIIHDKIHIITVDNDVDRGSIEWRELISPSAFCLEFGFRPITVNGILHWLAYTHDVKSFYNPPLLVGFVQSMDIAKEEFMHGISLPCQPKADSFHRLINCNLLEIEGSIYFSNPATEMELELWMLEDLANHIWVKKHKICLHSIVGKPYSLSSFLDPDSFYPSQMMGNHELIIAHDNVTKAVFVVAEMGWYLYNLRSQELKDIVCRSRGVKGCYFLTGFQVTHVRSLVGWN